MVVAFKFNALLKGFSNILLFMSITGVGMEGTTGNAENIMGDMFRVIFGGII